MLFSGFDTMYVFWSQAAAPVSDSTRAHPRCGMGPSCKEIDRARDFFQKVLELSDEEVIHLIVDGKNDCRRHPGSSCHVWHGPDRDTYVRLTDGLCASSPEACWCQMANRFDFVELVRFGYELCGTYRPSCPMGFDWTERPALTSRRKLAAYLDRLPQSKGSAKAQRALGFIVEGSASPRETLVALLLGLPRSCGGYGFPLPILNAKITLGRGGYRLTRKNYFVADMLWPEEKVCVEYDSDLFHAAEHRAVMDSNKRNALLALGYRVITLTNDQVKNVQRFDEFAVALAKLLGIRLRIRGRDWTHKRATLRRRLLMPSPRYGSAREVGR